QGSFLQSFVLETSSRPGPASSLDLLGPTPRRLDAGREWIAHGGSLPGEVGSEVVFVGYGAEIPEAGYDDYAGVDVRGRIALALDGAPAHLTDARVTRLDKLIAANRRGAVALLIAGGELPAPERTAVEVALVSGALTREAADLVLAPAGRTIAEATRAMSATRGPAARSNHRDAELRYGRPAARARAQRRRRRQRKSDAHARERCGAARRRHARHQRLAVRPVRPQPVLCGRRSGLVLLHGRTQRLPQAERHRGQARRGRHGARGRRRRACRRSARDGY